YNWPGNVRELQNVIERSLVLANENEHLGVRELPPELRQLTASDEVEIGSFHKAEQSFKRELARSALLMHGGNKLKAAKELGISRCYLHRLLNQLHVLEGAEAEAELQEEIGGVPEEDEDVAIAPVDVLRQAARIA